MTDNGVVREPVHGTVSSEWRAVLRWVGIIMYNNDRIDDDDLGE